jgi:hypothetical protein
MWLVKKIAQKYRELGDGDTLVVVVDRGKA